MVTPKPRRHRSRNWPAGPAQMQARGEICCSGVTAGNLYRPGRKARSTVRLMRETDDSYLYEQLAVELSQAIDRGALRAGDRLPSVRRLAEERNVSVATVLQAYLRLENGGHIE